MRWAIWSPYALVGNLIILHWLVIWSSYVVVGDFVAGRFGHFMYWWVIFHWANWGWVISHWAIYHVPLTKLWDWIWFNLYAKKQTTTYYLKRQVLTRWLQKLYQSYFGHLNCYFWEYLLDYCLNCLMNLNGSDEMLFFNCFSYAQSRLSRKLLFLINSLKRIVYEWGNAGVKRFSPAMGGVFLSGGGENRDAENDKMLNVSRD